MFDPEIGGLFCDYGECPMVPSSDKRCTYICNKEKKQGKLSLCPWLVHEHRYVFVGEGREKRVSETTRIGLDRGK